MRIFIKLLLLTLSIPLYISCSQSDDLMPDVVTEKELLKVQTRSELEDTTWTSKELCILNGKTEVKAPWSDLALTLVPRDIRKDVEEKDGWEILFSTVEIKGYTRNYNYHKLSENANYILFYNKYSGFLKGFCYIEKDLSQNNCGVWHLTVDGSTRLFNFADENAIPYDGPQKSGIYTTNITDEGKAGGFTRGWNCFMVELAYDESSISQHLNISGISLNQANYDYSGTMMFNTSGSYVTTSQSSASSLIKGAASAAGQGAKSIIEKWEAKQQSTTQPETRSIIGGLAAAGVTALVNAGLNKVFKSLTGSTKKTYNDITLTSQGNATITGTSQQPSSGIIPPLSGIALNGLGYSLGVWNVASTPKIEIERNWKFDGDYSRWTYNTYYYYTVFSRSVYNIIVNPIIASHHSSSDMLFSRFYIADSYFADNNFYPNHLVQGGSLYNYPGYFRIMLPDILPNGTTSSEIPCFGWERKNIEVHFEGFLSIKNIVNSPNGDFYSTHTFEIKGLSSNSFSLKEVRPYTWNYEELKSRGFIK